jgi:spermidine synthase
MKRILEFFSYFFLLGLISAVGQVVILREITSLFYGNEIFYGLGLGSWLLFAGLGSFLGIKLKLKQKFLWLILTGILFLIPVLVVLIRWLVGKFIPLGELPGFSFALLILGITLFPLCFFLGALFALGALKKNVNLAYFWETIGFAAGGLLFAFALSKISFPFGLEKRFSGLSLVINSQYQQILISEKEGQKNYFLNGQLAFTNKESFESKQLISLIAPFTKEPQKILIISSPVLVNEVKKIFPEAEVIFLEIDPKLLDLEKKLLDRRIKAINADARKFLVENNDFWDLIIFSPGNPQTLLGNRLFTLECFESVKKKLSSSGIFVLIFYLPTDYQSEEAAKFGSSIYKTLEKVWPNLKIITLEDQILFLASRKELEINQENIIPAFSDYFWYHLKNPQLEKIAQKLKANPAKINRDFFPVTFFYSQLFWQTIFSFRLPQLISKPVFLLPFLIVGVLIILLLKSRKNFRLGLLASSSSFILLSLEILLIFLFQIKIGYLYSQISLIFASVLLGIGAGVIKEIPNSKFQIPNFLGYFLIFGILFLLGRQPIFWFLTAFWLGMVGGGIFAKVNREYLKENKNPGYIYAFDLFGAVLGAILTSSFLFPVFGIWGMLVFLGTIIIFASISTPRG